MPRRSKSGPVVSATSLVILLLAGLALRAVPTAAATDTTHDKRIEELISRMTIEEKLGQLTQQSGGGIAEFNPNSDNAAFEDVFGAVRAGMIGSFLNSHGAEYVNAVQRIAKEESRLGIPVIFGNDVIHGFRTTFPIPLGESATWDPHLAEQAARVAATEAWAAGLDWTFAPMVDIARDPRWGRIAEGSGEDPYLGSRLAEARVKGFQGEDLSAPYTLVACAKHFVAYGAAEGGRDYNTVDISERTLREIHLPPFKAAVDAGVGTLMCAFNEINGIPATANRMTLTGILRGEWGFDGFVVSDWQSTEEMIDHGFVTDEKHAAEVSILAGVDMDMAAFGYREHLAKSVKEGRVPMAVIDEAVRRILRIKMRAGLFENHYRDPLKEKELLLCPQHRAIAREVARKSIVLLKNENGVLPISDKVKCLALIGPLAASKRDCLGTWAVTSRDEDVTTVLEAVKQRLGSDTEVLYAKGCDVQGDSQAGFNAAVDAALQADAVVMVIGESENLSGEGHCRSDINLPAIQLALLKKVHATGKPIAVVLMNGRPLTVNWMAENVPAILETWHLGTEAGPAIADVLFGDFNPGGKLPVTFPRAVGQIPIYYNHKNTGRPPCEDRFSSKYIDLPSTPLYPFGYGLSYTTFNFSNLQLSATKISANGELIVTATITNTGKRAGDEVAQLYIRDLVASVTRPVKQLRGFKRISLEPGEAQDITFKLTANELGFLNQDLKFTVEPGRFRLWVGPNSADGLSAEFEFLAQ